MLAFGVHQRIHQDQSENGNGHHDQVVGIQNRLCDRHRVFHRATRDFLQSRTWGGHRQRNGARETGVPYHEAAVGRGNQQSVVHAFQFTGNLLSKDHAHDETETPVEPAGDGRNQGHQSNGTSRCLGLRGQLADAFLDDGCRSQSRAAHQHQGHLHGKSQQRPYAVAPVVDDFEGRLVTHWHRHNHGDQGQNDSKNERLREIFLYELDAAPDDLLEHNKSN